MSALTPSTALLSELRQLIDGARQRAVAAVNAAQIVSALGRQLGAEYGLSWSAPNLRLYTHLALTYPGSVIVHMLYAKCCVWQIKNLAVKLSPATTCGRY
ncbi:hypothetical protein EAY64_05355 [Aquitalea palustris]|uniref:Uncharacterized protein n=1 Tax=Aquitalea palustris TaxID=2480983 RepID=A0A454JL58_9NEIS|nr:hypothetical protein [Aquitalea palustris]RMD00151.1 hypothetical protein EAY64_05355 [Aquitalea palustris]